MEVKERYMQSLLDTLRNDEDIVIAKSEPIEGGCSADFLLLKKCLISITMRFNTKFLIARGVFQGDTAIPEDELNDSLKMLGEALKSKIDISYTCYDGKLTFQLVIFYEKDNDTQDLKNEVTGTMLDIVKHIKECEKYLSNIVEMQLDTVSKENQNKQSYEAVTKQPKDIANDETKDNTKDNHSEDFIPPELDESLEKSAWGNAASSQEKSDAETNTKSVETESEAKQSGSSVADLVIESFVHEEQSLNQTEPEQKAEENNSEAVNDIVGTPKEQEHIKEDKKEETKEEVEEESLAIDNNKTEQPANKEGTSPFEVKVENAQLPETFADKLTRLYQEMDEILQARQDELDRREDTLNRLAKELEEKEKRLNNQTIDTSEIEQRELRLQEKEAELLMKEKDLEYKAKKDKISKNIEHAISVREEEAEKIKKVW